MKSATGCGISSTRSVVCNQAEGESSPKGADEIQPEGLMIYTARCAVMIYQACGLDKKIPKAFAFGIFWRRVDKKDAYFKHSKNEIS